MKTIETGQKVISFNDYKNYINSIGFTFGPQYLELKTGDYITLSYKGMDEAEGLWGYIDNNISEAKSKALHKFIFEYTCKYKGKYII